MYSQIRDGKVRFFETYIDPRTRQRKTVSTTMEKDTQFTRKKAQERLNARIRQIKAKNGQLPHLTLKELTEAYTRSREGQVKPQSQKNNLNGAETLKRIFGEDTLVSAFTAYFVTSTLDATGKTPAWKNGQIKYIRKLFRWAYKMDMVGDISFLDKVDRYKDDEKGRRAIKYMERDELERFLEAVKGSKYELLVRFMLLTGMRIGEVIALSKENIHDGKIFVAENYIITMDEIDEPKTESSIREIHIQKELQPIIDQLEGERPFSSVRYTTFRNFMEKTSEKVLHRRLPSHGLRHTHVSLLAASGVPLDVISRRLGHADSKITREIYLHVTSQLKDRDAAILDPIFLL